MANKKTKIQMIKHVIKFTIAFGVILLIIVLALFAKNTHTFENDNMKKWLVLSESQRVTTINRVISDVDEQDLLVACMNKIADLPNSDDMVVRDAIALCYNGIKLNAKKDEE